MSQEPLLKPEEVASVLSGGESGETEAEGQPALGGDPSAYSLREPVVIPPALEGDARKNVEHLASSLHTAILSVVGSEMTLETEGFQQQRVSSALSTVPPPAWVLGFDIPGRGRAALVLPPVLALGILEMALGGAGGVPEEGRAPTVLEQRVLRRFHASLVKPFREECGFEVAAGDLGFGEIPISFANSGETVGIGLLRCTVGENDQPALLLATAGLLMDRGDEDDAPTFEKIGPLSRGIGSVPVSIRPILHCGKIRMKDFIEMKKDSVILFDAPEGTPLRLSVAGQEIFSGQIVREDGAPRFAVTGRRGRPSSHGKETS